MKRSAGLLLFRLTSGGVEVLLAHPGGPFWAKRDLGAWTIPKGLVEAGEDELGTARREFEEEIGVDPGPGPFVELGEVTQAGGKVVVAWAVAGDLDPGALLSNDFELEWPPHSGSTITVPEIDRVAWFSPDVARRKVNAAQSSFIDRLESVLSAQNRS